MSPRSKDWTLRKIGPRDPAAIRINETLDRMPCDAFLQALPLTVRHLMELVFREGGYVAGGLARVLFQNRTQPALEEYLCHRYGDVDFFFRDDSAYQETVKLLCARKASVHEAGFTSTIEIEPSAARFATNVKLRTTNNIEARPASERHHIQLIGCSVGSPQDVLTRFDFRNCMVAFDRKTTWIAEGWREVEQRNELDIVSCQSEAIVWRVAKYLQKHKHELSDASRAVLIEQIQRLLARLPVARKQLKLQPLDDEPEPTSESVGNQLIGLIKNHRSQFTNEQCLLFGAFARSVGAQFGHKDELYMFG